MKIIFSNSFGGGYKPLYGSNFKPADNKSDFSLSNCNNFKSIGIEALSSKYNVSFSGLYDKKLEDFCIKLENKIEEMTAPKDAETGKRAVTPEYIEHINNEFKKNNIGSIYSSGVSANSMLNYLAAKKQLQLKGFNTAFVIDKMSLNFIKNQGIKNFYRDILSRNIKFYCLDTNEKETKKIIDEFNNLTNNMFKINVIKKNENSKTAKYPDAKKLKAIIKTFAQEKFSNNYAAEHKFIDIICRYMDNSFSAFSYASLEEKMKEQYKNIEKYIKSQGKTMNDIMYVIPRAEKSYDIVNYLYAKANNISAEKFIKPQDIKNGFNDGKIYVVLDDACASGNSILTAAVLIKQYTDNLIFAPVIGYNAADIKMKYAENSSNNKIKYLPLQKYKDLGIVNKFSSPSFINNEAAEAVKEFKNFNLEDASFLFRHIKGGISCNHAFVNFPYMIPDNSSELNAYIGGYFLNHDNPSANKAVCSYSAENTRRTKQTEYEYIKRKIEAEAA